MIPEEAAKAIRANYPPETYRMLREALDLALIALEGFQPGDADLLELFAEFVSRFKPDGHLNDAGKGAKITNQEAAKSLSRLADMARQMEESR